MYKEYKCRRAGTKEKWELIKASNGEIAASVFAEEYGVNDDEVVTVLGIGNFRVCIVPIYESYRI